MDENKDVHVQWNSNRGGFIPLVRVTRRCHKGVRANFKQLKDPWLWKQNSQRYRKIKSTDAYIGKLVNQYG